MIAIRRGAPVPQHISDVLQALAAFIGAIAALVGVVKGIPLLKDRLALMRERDSALQEARELRAAAEAYKISSEGWRAAVMSLSSEIKEIKVKLASAIIYIGALVTHVRYGGTELPEVPDELRDDVDAVLHNRKD